MIRVLYSFPHKIGADRICTTAWYQVWGLSEAGAPVWLHPGAIARALPPQVKAEPTLARGGLRLPYRMIGSMRAFWLHDRVVAARLERDHDRIDLLHAWPLGALRTLQVAARYKVPTLLERPNAHTRFAYEVVRQECERVGVPLPPDHEHAYNEKVLQREEAEYALATRLLCPSAFVERSFLDAGVPAQRLARHRYGYDEQVFRPAPEPRPRREGLVMLFAGGCAPRKGLHHALAAWLASPACAQGRFRIAGAFVPGYAERLSTLLAHPSVELLGHRTDMPDLMRDADVLVLPSVEEGSALVTYEARGSGCVLLVSDAAGAVCTHAYDALVHPAGDAAALTRHITSLHEDRALLDRLRAASLASVDQITWRAAGVRLLEVYRETLAAAQAG